MSEARKAAMRAIAAGNYREAAARFRAHLDTKSDDPDSWFALAYSLRQTRDYVAAISAYREALLHGVERPEEVHLNLGVIYSEHLLDVGAASIEIQSAIDANRRFVPAWLNLAMLREDLGDIGGATNAYEEVLSLDPANSSAQARLAKLAIVQGLAPQAVRRLESALAGSPLDAPAEAELRFAQAHALDSVGDYRRAWACAERANSLRWHLQAPSSRFDPGRHAQWVARLLAQPAPVSGSKGADPRAPVFICGLFRSGSTLAERLLSCNSDLAAGGELDLLPALIADRLPHYPERLSQLPTSAAAAIRSEYLAQAAAILRHSRRFSDKRCDNFLHLNLIARAFPGVRIVHTHRNRLDNVVSLFFGDFDAGAPYANRISDIASWCRSYDMAMDRFRVQLGDAIIDLSYDALVANPTAAMKPVFDVLGLTMPADGIISRPGAEPARTLSNWQVRQPIHGESSGRWRNYTQELRANGLC